MECTSSDQLSIGYLFWLIKIPGDILSIYFLSVLVKFFVKQQLCHTVLSSAGQSYLLQSWCYTTGAQHVLATFLHRRSSVPCYSKDMCMSRCPRGPGYINSPGPHPQSVHLTVLAPTQPSTRTTDSFVRMAYNVVADSRVRFVF